MRIYLAASFASKERLRPIRDQLFALGHDVCSSWLDEVSKPEHMDQQVFDRKLAIKDLVEAGGADLLIQDTLVASTTGGSHVEWGIGLGRFQRQLLFIVGPRVSVFHQLADAYFESWDDCLEWLSEQPIPFEVTAQAVADCTGVSEVMKGEPPRGRTVATAMDAEIVAKACEARESLTAQTFADMAAFHEADERDKEKARAFWEGQQWLESAGPND